jgi:hypothetical protein
MCYWVEWLLSDGVQGLWNEVVLHYPHQGIVQELACRGWIPPWNTRTTSCLAKVWNQPPPRLFANLLSLDTSVSEEWKIHKSICTFDVNQSIRDFLFIYIYIYIYIHTRTCARAHTLVCVCVWLGLCICASSLAVSSVTNCYTRRARWGRAITKQWGEKIFVVAILLQKLQFVLKI